MRFLPLGFLLLSIIYSSQAQNAGLPLKPGMSVVTCFSGINNSNAQNENAPVMAIFDTRDPLGKNAPIGENWSQAAGDGYHPTNWIAQNMGEVFGIALEEYELSNPDIYVSSCGLVSSALFTDINPEGGDLGTSTGGEIYRIDGTSGTLSTLATLPSVKFRNPSGYFRYTGAGQISYNAKSKVLYASNLSDGKIYIIDVENGGYNNAMTFDAGMALSSPIGDNENEKFTDRERMVFGIGYNHFEGRLYYSLPSSNIGNPDVYSVGTNPNTGAITGTPKFEFSLALDITNAHEIFISDISFSHDGTQMLIGCMGLQNPNPVVIDQWQRMAHESPVFRFKGISENWVVLNDYVVGDFGNKTNCAGGVDFGYNNNGACDGNSNYRDAAVMAADAIFLNTVAVYGIQISNIEGNLDSIAALPENSYMIDLDNETTTSDKMFLGDVEVYPAYLDMGDLPDNLIDEKNIDTKWMNDGPYHFIVNDLKLGAIVDVDYEGQENTLAQGDDSDGIDDEDGITTFPDFSENVNSCVNVQVTNTTGFTAKLYAFFDWDGDETFSGTNETVIVDVLSGANNVDICVTPPSNSTLTDVLVRLRITTEDLSMRLGSSNLWGGGANDGEVEDYKIAYYLPIELVSFKANYNESKNDVNVLWTTSLEKDVDYYEILRSTNGIDFETIEMLDNIEDSNNERKYQIIDEKLPEANKLYYQLKTMNLDGTIQKSELAIVNIDTNPLNLNIHPNPSISNISIRTNLIKGKIEIYNPAGLLCMEKEFNNDLKELEINNFPKGVYILRLSNEDKFVTTKFVKM